MSQPNPPAPLRDISGVAPKLRFGAAIASKDAVLCLYLTPDLARAVASRLDRIDVLEAKALADDATRETFTARMKESIAEAKAIHAQARQWLKLSEATMIFASVLGCFAILSIILW